MANGKLFEFPQAPPEAMAHIAMEYLIAGYTHPYAVIVPMPQTLVANIEAMIQLHQMTHGLLAENFPGIPYVMYSMRQLSQEEAAALVNDNTLVAQADKAKPAGPQ